MHKKNVDLAFTKRIRKIIEFIGSAERLAKDSGMSAKVIGQYLSGKSDPTRKKLIALAKAAGVNLEWLARGVGPMFDDKDFIKADLLAAIIGLLDDSEKERGLSFLLQERAILISNIYNLCIDSDPFTKEGKSSIGRTIDALLDHDQILGNMIETKSGRIRIRQVLSKAFEESLGEEESKIVADGLIGNILLKKYLKRGGDI
jgi:transcriptional regulator with XRE-family HTH domain